MSDDPYRISRREFTTLSLAAGAVAASGVRAAAARVLDEDVTLKTPAGECQAALLRPDIGTWPGVILFTDVFGLRPTMREMAGRLAREGYAVLVPNPFYRSAPPPGLALDIDFNNPTDRAKIDDLRKPLTSDAVMQDARAYVAFLDAHPAIDKRAKLGVFGYCMGGPMSLQAAAATPERIGAAASFHGGGLVTDTPDSPHLLIAKMKAECYIAIAMNDDQRQPEAKSEITQAFRSAGLPAKVEVYDGCLHGWCVKDMPQMPGKPPIYNQAAAERAWGELLALYRRAHV